MLPIPEVPGVLPTGRRPARAVQVGGFSGTSPRGRGPSDGKPVDAPDDMTTLMIMRDGGPEFFDAGTGTFLVGSCAYCACCEPWLNACAFSISRRASSSRPRR
jgi:hypothetical protein